MKFYAYTLNPAGQRVEYHSKGDGTGILHQGSYSENNPPQNSPQIPPQIPVGNNPSTLFNSPNSQSSATSQPNITSSTNSDDEEESRLRNRTVPTNSN